MTHNARTTAHEIRNKKRGRLCCVNSDTMTIQCVGRNYGFCLPLSTSPSPRLRDLLVRTSSIALPIALRASLHSYTGPPPAPQLSPTPRTLHLHPTPAPSVYCWHWPVPVGLFTPIITYPAHPYPHSCLIHLHRLVDSSAG